MINILVADDDKHICELIRLYCDKEGFSADVCHDGVSALDKFKKNKYDLVLLDVMMPYLSGYAVCSEVRKVSDIPVIMISAKGETADKVTGLDIGADDYIVKPFEPKELIARIKSKLRNLKSETKKIVAMDRIEINLTEYTLKIDGKIKEIPPKELELLYFMAQNKNVVFSRDKLLEKVWGYEHFGDSRTVDVHIKRIREKIDGLSGEWELKTVWGVGYKIETKD